MELKTTAIHMDAGSVVVCCRADLDRMLAAPEALARLPATLISMLV